MGPAPCGDARIALALAAMLAGCGVTSSTPSTTLRHSARVDAIVIRSLTTEPGVSLDGGARREVRSEAIHHVAEALDDRSAADVEALRLDINLTEIGPSGGGTRARCLITVSTVGPPERTRAILQGAATVHAHERPRVAAAAGAVRAALRRLPQALGAL